MAPVGGREESGGPVKLAEGESWDQESAENTD